MIMSLENNQVKTIIPQGTHDIRIKLRGSKSPSSTSERKKDLEEKPEESEGHTLLLRTHYLGEKYHVDYFQNQRSNLANYSD